MTFNSNIGIKKYEKNKCACGRKSQYYLKLDGCNSVFHLCEDCVSKLEHEMLSHVPLPSVLEEGKTYSRKDYKNHMKGWTDEEIKILTSGLYIDQLVEKLGKTEMSIRMKASRIKYEIPSRAKEKWSTKGRIIAKR